MDKLKIGDTVHYTDPVRQEFSGITRPPFTIDGAYPFWRKNPLYRILKWIVYRIFVTPVAFLYCRVKFRMTVVGREKLRAEKNGFYLFGNHTQVPGDGFIPNVLTFPRDTYVVVNPDNVALPGTRTLMAMIGAIPTPTVLSGFAGFKKALGRVIARRECVVIYPEAHIWPYATVIRPFPEVSFRYPVSDGAPAYAFTVTYRRRPSGKPAIVSYVDGPFYGQGATPKQRQKDLREQVYAAMKRRADTPENVAFIRYVADAPEEETV